MLQNDSFNKIYFGKVSLNARATIPKVGNPCLSARTDIPKVGNPCLSAQAAIPKLGILV